MRHHSSDISLPTSTRRARRIWHGHGCSRVIMEPVGDLPAAAIDEAHSVLSEPASASADQSSAAKGNWQSSKESILADLAAQLTALDKQREHLAHLLRSIDDAAIAK